VRPLAAFGSFFGVADEVTASGGSWTFLRQATETAFLWQSLQ
jgi:hypothetical protein